MREYWVIHAQTHTTMVHGEPSGTNYSFVHEFAANAMLVPALVPAFVVAPSTFQLN